MAASDSGVSMTRRAPKRLQKTLRYLEGSAVDSDVLAHHEDRLVTLHFFPKALANRFDVGHLGHGFPLGFASSSDSKPRC